MIEFEKLKEMVNEMKETHPYLLRNNGFELIGGDYWIKSLGVQKYEVVMIYRIEDRSTIGWVEFYEVDLTKVEKETIEKAWKETEIEFDEEVVSKEQILAEILTRECYLSRDSAEEFENEQELAEIMAGYKIVDDWKI